MRFHTMILVLIMVSVAQLSAFAGGDGSSESPYQVSNIAELQDVENNLDAHFIQTGNIDASATTTWNNNHGFNPIGSSTTPFTGSYDGQGYSINELYIYSTDGDIGLFGSSNSATLSNIVLTDCSVRGNDGTGGLVGDSHNDTITNCCVSGSVDGDYANGGLIGRLTGGAISSCYSIANVTCISTGDRTGGLVGNVTSGASIDNCYAHGTVSGDNKVGGLVGQIDASTVTNCYSTAVVTCVNEFVGGLISISENDATITNSYWNTETSGQSTSAGGAGKTTDEMKNLYMYHGDGWDFESETQNGTSNTWDMDISGSSNDGYPCLAWENDQIFLPTASGTGTSTDPYQIGTLYELFWVSANQGIWSSDFMQTDDIDANDTRNWNNGMGYRPIGKNSPNLNGDYDGQGFTIDGLYINRPSMDYVGLFGKSSANIWIKNVHMTNIDITGNNYVGGITGECHNNAHIYDCSVQGVVNGNRYVACIAGRMEGSNITRCRCEGTVNASTVNSGGITGFFSSSASVNYCVSSATINGSENTGGLAGLAATGSHINYSYCTGQVTGGSQVGGLVGYAFSTTIQYCYSCGPLSGGSHVGGLIGVTSGSSVSHSFWDMEASGKATSPAGTGLTTAEMTSLQTFLDDGWDFVSETANGTADRWDIDLKGDVNNGYPVLAWEDGDVCLLEIPSGSGTEADPYQIETLIQLCWVSCTPSTWSSHFVQIADIDAADTETWFGGLGFKPIGNDDTVFSGSYDGQFYTIDGLFINRPASDENGLFGQVTGGQISNLHVLNCDITGRYRTAPIAASCNNVTITNCHTSGTISSSNGGGGIAGRVYTTEITGCYSSVGVSSYNEGSYYGGITGGATINSTIANCYAVGNISSGSTCGGLVGLLDSSTVEHCYSIGSVTADSDVGGLIGVASGTYSVVGGFWDVTTSGQSSSAGGEGKTTSYMRCSMTYIDAGWDFVSETANGTDDVWDMDLFNNYNASYPFLSWQNGDTELLSLPLGSGTETDPYQIMNLMHLVWLSASPSVWGQYFLQTADIDANDTQNWNNGAGFWPIGNSTTNFTGYYDGGEHVIDGLYIHPGIMDVGFFGATNNATIENLSLTNADIDANDDGGVLAGELRYSTATNCHSSGTVSANYAGGLIGYPYDSMITLCSSSASAFGDSDAGGLIGYCSSSAIIQSFATGSVESDDETGGLVGDLLTSSISLSFATGHVEGDDNVGGLAGHVENSTINQSYATGNVTGGQDAGGLVGYLESGNAYDCFSTGDTEGDWAGGLVSDLEGTVNRCYSTGYVSGSNDEGGLVGYFRISGNTIASFWDVETSGQSTSYGGKGLTSTEMRTSLVYILSGWDFPGETVNGFDDIWVLDSSMNDGYPTFAWQGGTSESFAAPEGEGTTGNPYLIDSLDDLIWLSVNTNAWNGNILQIADIDASETQSWVGGNGFIPIGKEGDAFLGSYNGQGFTISGLYINRSDTENVGLWGYTDGAEITDVNLTNVVIRGSVQVGALVGTTTYSTVVSGCSSSGSVEGASIIGGLIGSSYTTSIIDCHTDGSVESRTTNGWTVGGLVGAHRLNGTMVGCYSEATVSGGSQVGGLIGKTNNSSLSTVAKCHCTGDVTGTGEFAGGLIGYSEDYTYLTDSYCTGSVTGVSNVGGLAGSAASSDTITNCYSNGYVTGTSSVGGFLSVNHGASINASFWDTETSGQSISAGGTGKTTAEMKTIYPYMNAGWDFVGEVQNGTEDIWVIFANEYPSFAIESSSPVITGVNDVPGDQGHQVDIVWNKASHDWIYSPNNFYTVWRLVVNTRSIGSEAVIIENPEQFVEPNHDQTLILHQRDNYWTWLATIPAMMHNQYSFISPTLIDSCASLSPEEYLSTYMVNYHFVSGYFASTEASGYSVDNIAPYATSGVTLSFNNTRTGSATRLPSSTRTNTATLSWNEVTEGGLNGNSYPEENGVWYRVYAGESPDFYCDDTSLLQTTQATSINLNPADAERRFFKIVVSDQP